MLLLNSHTQSDFGQLENWTSPIYNTSMCQKIQIKVYSIPRLLTEATGKSAVYRLSGYGLDHLKGASNLGMREAFYCYVGEVYILGPYPFKELCMQTEHVLSNFWKLLEGVDGKKKKGQYLPHDHLLALI